MEEHAMTGPVICGLDDVSSVVGAAPVASDLADRFGRRLLFVHVVQPGRSDAENVRAVLMLQQAVEALIPVDEAAWHVEHGHPADRLVEVAAEHEASFLVVGCHGPRSSLLGSISADVSRRASCPVVVVPPDAFGEPAGLDGSEVRRSTAPASPLLR
jgi:nucleotide-binding universal stress UspA family protein